jgi:CelD/BcsL family acetyltransferase involved in cellulose biosynthesis
MSAGSPLAVAATTRYMDTEGIEIHCHENAVPPFVEENLRRLYSSLYSSLAHRRIFCGMENASTYIVRSNGAIVDLWLFRLSGHRVQVLNEGIQIDEQSANRFIRYIFDRYPAVNVISFHAMQAKLRKLSSPFQRFNCLEDMVLTLPATADDYHASLGRSTRSYINRCLNRLRRDHPAFEFRAYAAHEIEESHVRKVVEFNRERMVAKGKVSINNEDTTQRIVQLAMECGMVCVLSIDGRICAGTVNYRIGDNYFLEVIAHDSAYSDYGLGMVCCYLTVRECIANGASEYHLLWGQDEYKTRLRAVRRDLDHLDIYRSRVQMLLNGDKALGNALGARIRQARLWLREGRRHNRMTARCATALLRIARRLFSPLYDR